MHSVRKRFVPAIIACLGIEYSLCHLSSFVCGMLPFMKPYHIRYLFRKIKAFKSLAFIINSFLEQYCNLPHIKLQSQNLGCLASLDKFGDKSIQAPRELITQYYMERHPLISQFILIIGMFYDLTNACYEKIRATNNPKLLRKYKNIKNQLIKFRYYMNKNKKDYSSARKTMRFVIGKDVQNIWRMTAELRGTFTNYATYCTPLATYCSFCGKQQEDDRMAIKFKKCSKCKLSYYCGRKCQKFDWIKHKKLCTKLCQVRL